MLATSLIFIVSEVEWISLIVIHEIKFCVYYLNNVYVRDKFPTPFNNEVLNNVAGHTTYYFVDGIYTYHQVHIGEEDKKKTTFTIEWVSYAYNFMLFGHENFVCG